MLIYTSSKISLIFGEIFVFCFFGEFLEKSDNFFWKILTEYDLECKRLPPVKFW